MAATQKVRGSPFVSRANSLHLTQLPVRLKKGIRLRPKTEQAAKMAQEFSISLRTAYRHIARGSLPARDRRFGVDGKRYPAGDGGRLPEPVEKNLRLAWQALNRASRYAEGAGYHPNDRERLAQISKLASRMIMETRRDDRDEAFRVPGRPAPSWAV